MVSFGQAQLRAINPSWVCGIAAYSVLVIGATLLMASAVENDSLKTFLVAIAALVSPLLAALALKRPLIFPFGLYAVLVPFDNLLKADSSTTLTRLVAIAAGGAIVLHLLLSRDAVRPSRAALVWAVLMIWMAESIFWAIDPSVAADWFSRYIQLFLLYIIVAILPAGEDDLRFVIGATMVGAVAAAAYGDYLFYHHVDEKYMRLFIDVNNNRIDPNHFAASLVMPFAIALMAFLRARMLSLQKWLWLITAAVIGSGFYTSVSRGAAVAVGVLVLYLLVRSKYRLQLLILAIPAAALAAGGSIGARFMQAASSGGNGRLNVWSSGVAAFKEYWLIGAGVGNYPNAYDQVYLQVYHAYYPYWHSVAHDLLAQSAVELGIGGLALMLFAWWCEFRVARTVEQYDGLQDFALALQAGVLGLFITSLFLDIMWMKYTWLAFIIIAVARNWALRHRELVIPERKIDYAQQLSSVRAS